MGHHRCAVCSIELPSDAGPVCVPCPDRPGTSWRYGDATCIRRRGEKWQKLREYTARSPRAPRRITPEMAARREALRALVIELQAQRLGVRATVRELRRRGVKYVNGAPSYELVMRMREKQ